MTIGLVLSILFGVLQITGQIDWEWWQIIMPSLIEIGLIVTIWFFVVLFGVVAVRR